MVLTLDDLAPALFIAPNAVVVGQVSLGRDTSVWYGTVIRGDMESISIGDGSNVQDNAVLHVDSGFPLSVGRLVTIGHGAIVHGCTVGDEVLVGMGSIILNGAEIGDRCIVGAGALVPPGKKYPERSLLVGNPARVVRTVTDEEIERIVENARHYQENARRHASQAGMNSSIP